MSQGNHDSLIIFTLFKGGLCVGYILHDTVINCSKIQSRIRFIKPDLNLKNFFRFNPKVIPQAELWET